MSLSTGLQIVLCVSEIVIGVHGKRDKILRLFRGDRAQVSSMSKAASRFVIAARHTFTSYCP